MGIPDAPGKLPATPYVMLSVAISKGHKRVFAKQYSAKRKIIRRSATQNDAVAESLREDMRQLIGSLAGYTKRE